MTALDPTTLRIDATLAATQPVHWPHFAGSALRGAFGRALRRAACVTGQPQCHGCPLRAQCAYGAVFDPAAPEQPLHPSFQNGLPRYLLQPPPLGAGQCLADHTKHFTLILLPGALPHQALIEHTLRAAVETELVKPGVFKLVQTNLSQTRLTAEPPAQLTLPPQAPARMALRWLTPVRLQQQGKPLFKPQQLDARTLVRAALRRQLQWQEICQTQPAADAAEVPLQAASLCTLDIRHLQWHDLSRHSSSQNQHLPLGGLLGSATLLGPAHALQTLLPLLQLGEQLHIGKEIVMGLGRFQLGPLQPA